MIGRLIQSLRRRCPFLPVLLCVSLTANAYWIWVLARHQPYTEEELSVAPPSAPQDLTHTSGKKDAFTPKKAPRNIKPVSPGVDGVWVEATVVGVGHSAFVVDGGLPISLTAEVREYLELSAADAQALEVCLQQYQDTHTQLESNSAVERTSAGRTQSYTLVVDPMAAEANIHALEARINNILPASKAGKFRRLLDMDGFMAESGPQSKTVIGRGPSPGTVHVTVYNGDERVRHTTRQVPQELDDPLQLRYGASVDFRALAE